MTSDELAKKINQTLLRPDVTIDEMACFLAEGTSYPFTRPWGSG